MVSRVRLAGVALLVLGLVAAYPSATNAVTEINNLEQKVNGEGARGDAIQEAPDISSDGWVVWWDSRGSAAVERATSLWSKDLNTHTETRLTVLSTPHATPRISGTWVVWSDTIEGSMGIVARQLPPTGPFVYVTSDPTDQVAPVVDGTDVVWEDYRNSATTGIDLYMRNLTSGPGGGLSPEVVVTNSAGDQINPEISGDYVVWTDLSNPAEPRVMGRLLTEAPGAEFVVSDPDGVSADDPAVSGSRVAWAEGDRVKTCELSGGSGCASPAVEVWPNGGVQQAPDVYGSRVAWLDGDAPNGMPAWVWSRDLSVAGPNPPTLIDAPANGAKGFEEGTEHPRIDGTKLTWPAFGFRGADVFWKDLADANQPARVNSPGLGAFGNQSFPSASGSYLTYFADSGDFNPRNAIWATELSGDRRIMRVSTFADFGTAISPPKINGNRVAWSDFRDGDEPNMPGPNTLYRDLPSGVETRITTAGIGNNPDIYGDKIAWLCVSENTFVCVNRNGTITRYDLPATDTYMVDQQLRIDGDVVLWSEFLFDPIEPWIIVDSKVHALSLVNQTDSLLGAGPTGPSFFPSYDIVGADAAWMGLDGLGNSTIYRNTVDFPCTGSGCDRSGLATQLYTGATPGINQMALDGTRVAWVQAGEEWTQDVWLKELSAPAGDVPVRVTSNGTATGDITLYGDFVYWTDGRSEPGAFCDTGYGCNDVDVYREYVGSGTPPPALPADTTAPGGVIRLTAIRSGASIGVSWTNPSTADLTGVIVVRKTVAGKGKPTPATGFDDPNSTIVFDGMGTGFVDYDVNPAVAYIYTAFAYDEVPNYSFAVSTK